MKHEHAESSLAASELPYPTTDEFPDSAIIPYLVENLSLSMPPKPPHGSHHFTLTHPILGRLLLPLKYRLPLLWTQKYMWHSLHLVLTASERDTEWEEFKYMILHIGREIFEFLIEVDKSRKAIKGSPLWRCTFFDRMLVRFWDGYLVNDPEGIERYEKHVGTGSYREDVLRNDWKNWVRTSHQGFYLTMSEIENGVTAEEFTNGLVETDGIWNWESGSDSIYSKCKPTDDGENGDGPPLKKRKVVSWNKKASQTPVTTTPRAVVVKIEPPTELPSSSEAPSSLKRPFHTASFKIPILSASTSGLPDEVSSRPKIRLASSASALAVTSKRPVPTLPKPRLSRPSTSTNTTIASKRPLPTLPAPRVATSSRLVKSPAAAVVRKPTPKLPTASSPPSILTPPVPTPPPSTSTSISAPTPLPAPYTQTQNQIKTLTALLSSLRSSVSETMEEQRQLKQEMGIAQAEVRELRRLVDEAGKGEANGGSGRIGNDEETVGWFGEHPLGHLLDAD